MKRAARTRVGRTTAKPSPAPLPAPSCGPAGYSGTPLAKKLGFKPGARALLIGAPPKFRETLVGLPDDVTFVTPRSTDAIDLAVLFTPSSAELQRQFENVMSRLAPAAGLWVAWPKKSSGVASDLTEDLIRNHGLRCGLVDNKVCAIDRTWSGLRFVRRLKDR